MALSVRRRLPYVLGPLVLGLSFHVARHQLIANESSAPGLLNPAQVSARLRGREESYVIDRGNGVLRHDFAQLPSNNPTEDDHSEKIIGVPLVTPDDHEYSTDWHFWGLYDGHAGFSTSAKLRENLIPRVVKEVNQVYASVAPGSQRRIAPDQPELIDQALVRAFVGLDNEIVHESVEKLLAQPTRKQAIEKLPPALSGSCALLAFYDTASRDLRIALAGDSRAVLGMRTSSGHWQAKALTADQTGSNEDEARRIRAEHPQSEKDTCVRRGRVLGVYEPSRSFGDAAVKWSRETQSRVADLFFSSRVPSYLSTPPYMTAEPVVTRTRLEPDQRPYFLVMASDGVFELLSNDQVVGLVVDWLQHHKPPVLDSIISKDSQGSSVHGANRMGKLGSLLFGKCRNSRQIGDPVEDITEHKEALKQPIYASKQLLNSHRSLQVTVQDTNVATHIIRNALGGADQEQVSLLLSIPPPMSRNYRDDLTVTVVFFGDHNEDLGEVSGAIRTNPDATQPRPKL